MIIAGYPGVGKTTFCIKNHARTIDLESSLFPRLSFINDFAWADVYAKVANELSRDGRIVFVSTHGYFLKRMHEVAKSLNQKIFVVIPDPSIKNEWLKRLEDRVERTGLNKDSRAFIRARNHFDEDINDILNHDDYRIIKIGESDLNLDPYLVMVKILFNLTHYEQKGDENLERL